MRRFPNPYANLGSLLDATRQLDPEEMAELQLEQGYPKRALAIYEALLSQEPANTAYRRRRDWLLRVTSVVVRPTQEVRQVTVDTTLRGVLPPQAVTRAPAPRAPEPSSRVEHAAHPPREVGPPAVVVLRNAVVGKRSSGSR